MSLRYLHLSSFVIRWSPGIPFSRAAVPNSVQDLHGRIVTAVIAVDDGAGGTMQYRRVVSMHVDSVGPPALRGPVGG